MIARPQNLLAPLVLALLVPSCMTTPLPIPPTLTVEVNAISIETDARGGVTITGFEGAIMPGGEDVRMTYGGMPSDSAPPDLDEFTIAHDGSFQTWLQGSDFETYFIEHLWTTEDIFLLAITGNREIDSPGATIVADPGGDSDGDGSPDQIDCAPLDETYGGQRCP